MTSEQEEDYIRNKTNWGAMPFHPMFGWNTPFVTGHKHRIFWSGGYNTEQLSLV
jgi:hypothetical protein